MKSAAQRAAIGVLTAVVVVLGLAGSANAAASSSAIVNTGGTRAGETWFNRSTSSSHFGYAWVHVYDAKCDGHSVFAEVSWLADGKHTKKRFEHFGGCYSGADFNIARGYFAISYRTCVNVQLGDDPCSEWINDHN